MNGFSLFERWEARHRHFENDADVQNELFALFEKARNLYREEVVTNQKSYTRFVEDFYHGNRYISCHKCICKNIHEVNIHVVYQLLSDCYDLSIQFLTAENFTLQDCVQLKKAFDQTDCNPPKAFPTKHTPVKEPPLTFGRCLTKEQIMRITAIATANYLFSFYGDPQDDIRSLLECKKGFHLIAANIRNVAVMFDTLYEIGLISRGWQTVIEKRGLLYSKNGIPVTASSLSSALSSIKRNPTAMTHAIRMMVMENLSDDK